MVSGDCLGVQPRPCPAQSLPTRGHHRAQGVLLPAPSPCHCGMRVETRKEPLLEPICLTKDQAAAAHVPWTQSHHPPTAHDAPGDVCEMALMRA